MSSNTTPAAAPKRIQLSRAKGWRKPTDAVVVARPTSWGNLYAVQRKRQGYLVVDRRDGRVIAGAPDIRSARTAAVELFALDAGAHPLWQPNAVRELAGRDLACWCPLDQPCHADVLLQLANRGAS
jgi:hypothetical protein